MKRSLLLVVVLFALVMSSVSVVFASETRFLDLGLFGACKIEQGITEFPKDCRLTGFSLEEISSNGMTITFRLPFGGWVDTNPTITPYINGVQHDFGIYSDLSNRDDNILSKDDIVQFRVSKNTPPEEIWFRVVLKDDLE